MTLPGNVNIVYNSSSTNTVVDPAHPLVAGVPSPFSGTSASHSYFSNLVPNTQVIVVDDGSNPNLIEYFYGAGRVIASGQTLDTATTAVNRQG